MVSIKEWAKIPSKPYIKFRPLSEIRIMKIDTVLGLEDYKTSDQTRNNTKGIDRLGTLFV
jgi:hypothetical protein